MTKGRKYDGKSRPSNTNYRRNYNEIFKKKTKRTTCKNKKTI